MKFTELEIKGVWLIEAKKYGDARGYFTESFKKELFESHVGQVNFIQDNESKSSYGVLRGLHFQTGEFAQAKLVRAVVGSVLDVVVDVRHDSPTYGKHVAVELSAENSMQLFMPRGMAHGFVVLSDTAIFAYKVDNTYAPHSEGCLLATDPELGIDWRVPLKDCLMSDKDKIGTLLKDL
ncbi:MAG: dTDP-4-dehydrorhamnose 3,5-epimerase [Bacteroidales bacterium]|nr:dTDP-4-dehydrorhamnose 3,5-epimerase [Bacteroidales bacterium]